MSQQYAEFPREVRIAARAMADSKYHLASGADARAIASAETEYRRLMDGYASHGENSELATRMRQVKTRR